MMNWEVESKQSDDEFLDEYVRLVIASETPILPPNEQKIGSVVACWEEIDPGVAHIYCIGGNSNDRSFGEFVVREQLRGHGYEQARFSVELDPEGITKESTWPDVEAKAKRLVQDGNVQLLRNGANNIIAQVQGDHGNYQVEIGRDDPNSQAITTWNCECPWSQHAWQRTRQWKKYEGRVCSHALAAYWKSRTTPLDEEFNPAGPTGPPPQGSPAAMVPPVAPQPQSPGILPQFPMDPSLQPQVNPASVPGQKLPDPTNPIQYPGGTFSSWQFDSDTMWHMGTVPPNSDFENSSMVQLKDEDVGIAEGRSEEHGSGEYRTIPSNSIGETLGVDPSTGWVDVIFPIHDAGPMEPYHIRGWFEPEKLIPRPDLRRPGPFIRRRKR